MFGIFSKGESLLKLNNNKNMKAPVNENYAASVVRLGNLRELENCDNVVTANIFGYNVIVGKDTQEGLLGVFFPAEVQLSDDFCRYNNLYRHKEKNVDPEQAGYIEDNRRVRAVKFRGNTSNGFFMPMDSLIKMGLDITKLEEGDVFDELEGKEICKKYEVYRAPAKENKQQQAKKSRVDKIYMPEHIDTTQYFRNKHLFHIEDRLIITQKLHGTSIRIGNILVKRNLSWIEKLAMGMGMKIVTYEYDYVYGSRKAIKDPNNEDQMHFYDSDIWASEGAKLKGLIPEGYVVYGELIGYTPSGKPIQGGYTYGHEIGSCSLYVYRVAYINEIGFMADLSWEQLKQFCDERGIKYVPEIAIGEKDRTMDEAVEWLMDLNFSRDLDNTDKVVPLPEGTVDEGVCIRRDDIVPLILKAKSPKFYEHETKLLDKGEVDMETASEEV